MLSYIYDQEYFTIQVYKDQEYVALLDNMFDRPGLFIRTFGQLSLKECQDLMNEILKTDFIVTVNDRNQYIVTPVSEEALCWNATNNEIYFNDSVIPRIIKDGFTYVMADYQPSDDND